MSNSRAEAIGEAIDTAQAEARHRGPSRARRALLAQPIKVGPVTLDPFNLLVNACMEEINHPMLYAGIPGAPPVRPRDILNLLFIFACPVTAYEMIGQGGPDEEIRARVGSAAAAWARTVPATIIPDLRDAVQRAFAEGQPPAVPGSGSPPPEAIEGGDTDPLP